MSDSFTARFTRAWAEPTAEGLVALLHENVVLRQPHLPPIHGKQAAHAEFTRLFAWLPGTYSEVTHAQETRDSAWIEHVLHLPAGNGFIRLPTVDRFQLRDGLGLERVAYFDQARLMVGVLRHPGLWPGYLRYRWGSRK